MTGDEAIAILERPRDQAVDLILALAEKAEKYDQICGEVTPTTPSGMTPVYLKPSRGKRKKRPGRKKGHPGVARIRPGKVDHYKGHSYSRTVTIDCLKVDFDAGRSHDNRKTASSASELA
jgi:transposase